MLSMMVAGPLNGTSLPIRGANKKAICLLQCLNNYRRNLCVADTRSCVSCPCECVHEYIAGLDEKHHLWEGIWRDRQASRGPGKCQIPYRWLTLERSGTLLLLCKFLPPFLFPLFIANNQYISPLNCLSFNSCNQAL